jgi:AraC-like DNA-binding protein
MAEPVVEGAGISVLTVRCGGGEPGWSRAEPVARYGLVLVRSGVFGRRVDGREVVVDATGGYLNQPGSEQRMAHPAGGDVCTAFGFGPGLLDDLGTTLPDDAVVRTTAAADVQHRALATAPIDEREERAVVLVGTVLTGLTRDRNRPGTTRVRRAVDQARQAVGADPGLGLGELAAITGLSAYHLSRSFRQASGLTLSRYRSRLKVRRVLERLAGGDRDLAGLAFEHGFADQAHLTRTVRRETGRTPGELRSLLGQAAGCR